MSVEGYTRDLDEAECLLLPSSASDCADTYLILRTHV